MLFAQREFNWRPVVGPRTSPRTIEVLKEIEATMAKLASSVSADTSQIPEIDWKHYSKLIKNRKALGLLFQQWVLKNIRISFDEVKRARKAPASLTEFNAEIDKIIAQQKEVTALTEDEAQLLRSQIIQLEIKHTFQRNEVPATEKLLKSIPGLQEQLNKEYEDGEFVATEAEEAIYNLEPSAIREALEKGDIASLVDKVPADRLGDFKMEKKWEEIKAWEQKVYGKIPGFKSKLPEKFPLEIDEDPYADEKSEEHH